MIFTPPLSFITEFVEELDQGIRKWAPNRKLSTIQRYGLRFCLMGILLSNQVCWAAFERVGLGGYSPAALSWMFRHSKLRWPLLLHVSILLMLEKYHIAQGELVGYTAPRFKAKDAAGAVVGERRWPEGEALGHDGAVSYLAGFLRERLGEHRLAAVGHRVVHGGLDYAAPVRLTVEIIGHLERFILLAPLHQPHNLKPIRLLLANQPYLPQVACFDTAFHHCQPDLAQVFALPAEITERGVRRYGFHGLSYEYIASVLPQVDPQAATGRTVVLHLGNGASMCAIHNGNSVASGG